MKAKYADMIARIEQSAESYDAARSQLAKHLYVLRGYRMRTDHGRQRKPLKMDIRGFNREAASETGRHNA